MLECCGNGLHTDILFYSADAILKGLAFNTGILTSFTYSLGHIFSADTVISDVNMMYGPQAVD